MPQGMGANVEWTTRAKLAPPEGGSNQVYRTRLLERLTSATPPAKIIFLDAPAGYGKTTLLAQLYDRLRSARRCTVWLTLGPDDQAPSLFVRHLATAFAHAGVDVAAWRDGEQAPPRTAMETLINAVAGLEVELALFLDDCHRARSAEVARLFDYLIENMPPNMQLLVSGRGRLSRRFTALEMSGALRRLSQQDLRFDLNEAEHYLHDVAAESQAPHLLERTEGWPVALQLVRLWLSSGERNIADLTSVSGRSSELAQYLAEVVFQDLPEPLKDFLLETSILERLNGDLINGMRDRNDSWLMLEKLQTRSLFIAPLDHNNQWFRYHALFGEFLRERLRREQPGREAILRCAAARWLMTNGHWHEAIRQALRTEDLDFAAALVEENDCSHVVMSIGTSALTGFERMDTPQLAQYPGLALGIVYKHLQDGHIAAARTLHTAIGRHFSHNEPGHDSRRWSLYQYYKLYEGIIYTYEDRAIPESLQQFFQSQVIERSDATLLMRGEALSLMAQANYYVGADAAAFAYGQHLAVLLTNLNIPFFEKFSHIICGLLLLAQGQLSKAEQHYQACLSRAEDAFEGTSIQTMIAQFLLAEVAYERGDAKTVLEVGARTHGLMGMIGGWYEAFEAYFSTLAPLVMERRGWQDGVAFLQELEEFGRREDRPRHIMLSTLLKVREAARLGEVEQAERWARAIALRELVQSTPAPANGFGRQRYIAVDALLRLDYALQQTAGWLPRLLALAEGAGRDGTRRWQVHFLAAHAAFAATCDPTAAAESAHKALQLAAPERFLRPFLEWPRELHPVLRALTTGRALPPAVAAFAATVTAALADGGPVTGGGPSPLSRREEEVLAFIAQGMTSKEIARELGISVGTVKGYRKELFYKLNVSSRSQALRRARTLKLMA